ncbi:sodium/proline symporter PutP [Sediminicurvatus halobius]|uniref:Sodium/proline symporter n=1 Tax=Sediminicurvatus halobius TaxID=2182432 RepID=A0A2U2N430_9GAMM|nr:sodium/proline symporter PutP [Spiribacter halobius]PWG63850.1 sodium/proline symporter PutP [Spiribacter halobius]UEX76253.1 sodium/proline symporter PutP [Spiribacter halobius]
MEFTLSGPTLVTFIVYLVAMLAIGVIFYRLTNNLSDYVLGGRQLGPGVAALSAGASDMSGWLLLGLPGAVYAGGMNQAWIAIGLTIGAYLNWQFVAKRLRIYTEVASDSITVPDYLENRFADASKALRVISALVILLFFAFYTSSGLVAGAKLFETSFGLNYQVALWVGGLVIISYTFLGGFLAVSWTDFFQGLMMFFTLVVVPIIVINVIGGWEDTVAAVAQQEAASYNNIMSGMTLFSIVSLMAWGLGYFGQPHIITRFMAIRSAGDVPTARLIGMTWMVVGLFGAIFAGYTGIAYFADNPLEDSEVVFMALSNELLNPWLAGVVIAAILAAVMSTIDSQLLVSSSAVAEDFYKALLRPEAGDLELVWVGRIAVAVIALIALLLAMNPDSTVLGLVAYAWGGFGAAFGPVIILSLFWRGMSRNGAIAGIIVGAATVVIWKQLSGGMFDMYEILPGFILCALTIVVVSKMAPPSGAVTEQFDRAARQWT